MATGTLPSHVIEVTCNLWNELTVPAAAIEQAGQRRLARLLATTLMVVLPIGFAILVIEVWSSMYPIVTFLLGTFTLAILFVAYVLSRTPYYTVGSWLTVITITVACITIIFASQFHIPNTFLTLSSLLATLLLSARAALIAVSGNVLSATLLPLVIAHQDPEIVAGDAVFLLAFSVILGVFIWLRHVNLKQMDAQTEKLAAAQQHYAELALKREHLAIMQQFIKDVSHDFKTPLSIINTGVYMLRKSSDPDKREYYLNALEDQSRRMTELLDQLRTMSRLDDQVAFTLEPTNINSLIRSIGDNMQPAVKANRLKLNLQLAEKLPLVDLDGAEISLALINLVENALKHTPAGGTITIRTALRDDHLMIEIKDDGEGIRADDLPHIFDPFYRTDKQRSAETGGIGLGLSIVKRIIETHHGQIAVESQFGGGSLFRIALPVNA